MNTTRLLMSVKPTKIPQTREDLEAAAFETELKNEIKPLAWEINERINRLDSQEKVDEPPKRDEFGMSAWDYSMLKYKITLGELKDDLVAQRKLLGTYFYGLGKSVAEQKEEQDLIKKNAEIQASPIQTDGKKESIKEDSRKEGK